MLRFLPLCSLLLLLAAPAAAPAYDPIQVFRADHATAALPGPERRTAVLRPDRGPRRTVAPPIADCGFWAAGTGRLVWDCGATIAVTDLHGGDVHQQPTPFYTRPDSEDPASFQIDRVGSHWLGGIVSAARAQDGSYYLNWRTGAHHSSNADTSPVAYPDVNAPGLFTPLCAGARRAPNRSTRDGPLGHGEGRRPLDADRRRPRRRGRPRRAAGGAAPLRHRGTASGSAPSSPPR